MRVIIVDDEPDMLTVLRALLEEEGYDVLAAPDGQRGLEVIRATPERCVVLVDMAMPGMDGAAVLRAVAADTRLAAHHAYALMTAGLKEGGEEVDETLALLDAPVILKPYDLDLLYETVDLLATRLMTDSNARSS
jgi:CheY-like chemotaxis protein